MPFTANLTAINWCMPYHGANTTSLPPPPFHTIFGAYPCDIRYFVYSDGDDGWTGMADRTWSPNVYEKLCMPRWIVVGYQDRSAIGGSDRHWVGPSTFVGYGGTPTSGSSTISYGGTDILTMTGNAVSLGIVPNPPQYNIPPGEEWTWETWLAYALSTGCPLEWISTITTSTQCIAWDLHGNCTEFQTHGWYSPWTGLPDDLVIYDPIYWGGGFEEPQIGKMYGFNYDGPLADPIDGTDSSGNPVSIQALKVTSDSGVTGGQYSAQAGPVTYFYCAPHYPLPPS